MRYGTTNNFSKVTVIFVTSSASMIVSHTCGHSHRSFLPGLRPPGHLTTPFNYGLGREEVRGPNSLQLQNRNEASDAPVSQTVCCICTHVSKSTRQTRSQRYILQYSAESDLLQAGGYQPAKMARPRCIARLTICNCERVGWQKAAALVSVRSATSNYVWAAVVYFIIHILLDFTYASDVRRPEVQQAFQTLQKTRIVNPRKYGWRTKCNYCSRRLVKP